MLITTKRRRESGNNHHRRAINALSDVDLPNRETRFPERATLAYPYREWQRTTMTTFIVSNAQSAPVPLLLAASIYGRE